MSILVNSSYYNHRFYYKKWSILNFFIILALLRLTNFNYYLSSLCGLEVEVNNTGGGAFNFINYIGFAVFLTIVVGKFKSFTTSWRTIWPMMVLISIYLINAILAPYVNPMWVLYQVVFIFIAIAMHCVSLKAGPKFKSRFIRGTRLFFWLSMVFVLLMTLIILSQISVTTYLLEFNDSFVQSLDDYGIMKQRYGYFLGFLLSYAIFILKPGLIKWLLICLILFAGIGIRSLLIGLVGAGFIFTIKSPRYFLPFLAVLIVTFYFLLGDYFSLLIYDTRFYSFLNAADIIQKFPFGVGLGGYPVYTEIFSRELFGNFYNVEAILDYVPTAPESDLVHIFGSLGLFFGAIHIAIIGRLIWFTYSLQYKMDAWQKCIAFYFCYMTFFGISEDSIFSINYWIFFGITSGIITYLLFEKYDFQPRLSRSTT